MSTWVLEHRNRHLHYGSWERICLYSYLIFVLRANHETHAMLRAASAAPGDYSPRCLPAIFPFRLHS